MFSVKWKILSPNWSKHHVKYMSLPLIARGHAMAQFVEELHVAGSIPEGVIEIFVDIILPAALWPNRNDYQEYFLWGKGGRCMRLTNLPPSWRLGAWNSWNPQGFFKPLQGLLYLLPLSKHSESRLKIWGAAEDHNRSCQAHSTLCLLRATCWNVKANSHMNYSTSKS